MLNKRADLLMNYQFIIKGSRIEKMNKFIDNLSMNKAAMIVGIGFIIMFLLALFADGFVLQSLVVPGDSVTTIDNIKADEFLFWMGIVGYIFILALDVTGSMGSIPHYLVKDGLPNIMDGLIKKGIADPQVLFMGIGDHECECPITGRSIRVK